MLSKELFLKEKQTIQIATELTKSELFSDNPINENFSDLLTAYQKLYHDQARLIEMGDIQLKQLNRLVRQIKIILDNIPVGIVIVDKHGNIQPSYSQHMHALFDLKIISGMYIEDVLYLDNKEKEERETFKNWLKLVFDISHDWDLIAEIAPDLVEYNFKGKKLSYKIKYHRITNENQATSLMIYLVDVTERIRQKQLLKRQKAEHNFGMEIFSALLSQDDNSDTSDFIYETKSMIDDCLQLFNSLNEVQEKAPVYDNIFRLMHSVKGLSKTYGMNELANLAHSTEEVLNKLKSGKINFEAGLFEGIPVSEKIPELLNMMTTLMDNAERIIKKLFKRETGTISATRAQRRGIKVDSEKISELIEICESIETHSPEFSKGLAGTLSLLKEKVKDLVFQPLSIIYDRLYKIVDEVSETLDKAAKLNISGDKILLSDDSLHLVIASLIHLLRNSLDHGIEQPDIREAAGKSPSGEITIKTTNSEDRIHIIFEDDGEGIDPRIIAEKAIEKNLITASDVESLNEDDKISLILLPGFSSKDEATEISGRGVGLDVVNDAMEQLGGSLKIESDIGKGTRFHLSFPINF